MTIIVIKKLAQVYTKKAYIYDIQKPQLHILNCLRSYKINNSEPI